MSNQIKCCEKTEVHKDLLEKVNASLPDEEKLYDLAELFKVFGDSTRMRSMRLRLVASSFHDAFRSFSST